MQGQYSSPLRKNDFRKFCDRAHRLTVRLIGVVQVCVTAIEVQVVRVVAIVLRTAPIVAVLAYVVERTVVVVAIARSRQKNTPLL